MATEVFAAQRVFSGWGRSEAQAADRNLALLAAQRRARRGPTPEVFFAKRLDNTRLVKADDPVRVREMRTFTAAMTVLFLFSMFYGWQHFSAIEYGYRVEAAKQQRQALEEQNRQLLLTQAELCNPGRIDRLARRLGLGAPRPGQVVRPDSEIDAGAPALAQASPIFPGSR